jgi:ubiquinone/menaquinone biosynthesis C-methylase UbiE
MPEHILLLQADLNDLPFRPNSFNRVLCMNVLHQFEHAEALFPDLKRLLTDNGQLYMTSLVTGERFVGDAYLKMLYTMGEFVRPRRAPELKTMVERTLDQDVSYRVKGNMAFITTATSS